MEQLDVYQQMAIDLRQRGHAGDMETTEIINYHYQIDADNPWFALKERKLNVPFIMKELIWYLEGNPRATWIGEHAALWKSVIDHDGMAVSNYGWEAFGKQGLKRVISLLEAEPMTRRAILYFGDNAYVKPHTLTKDQPCANSVHWMVRGGLLRTVISQRSQDYIYGVSGDAVFFTMLTNIVAAMLQVPAVAPIDVQVASFHHYPKHTEMVTNLMNPTPYHIPWRGSKIFKAEATDLLGGGVGGPFANWVWKESGLEDDPRT